MAKRKPDDMTAADDGSGTTGTIVDTELEYIGPPGQESPVFGPLVVGQRYQASETFVSYLVERHPDYWKRPDA